MINTIPRLHRGAIPGVPAREADAPFASARWIERPQPHEPKARVLKGPATR